MSIDEKALAATLDVSERRDWDDITASIRYYEAAKAKEQPVMSESRYHVGPDGSTAKMGGAAIKEFTRKASDQPVVSPRIQELEIFIEQMHATLKSGKIRDFDTNWRITEKVMPPSLECVHAKDEAEISGAYRKIHLSDILSAARELITLHWKRQPERESGWQPIETAPKDGTEILIAWGDKVTFSYWLDNSKTSHPWQGWKLPSMFPVSGKPSHWMPIPKIPRRG
jgi:hypothetical protein